MRFAVLAHAASETNLALAARGWAGSAGELMSPRTALGRLESGDVALNRLDVRQTLDGVEEGLWMINQLQAQGVRVLNTPSALLAAHDKLLTARLLEGAGLPHPRTVRLSDSGSAGRLRYPVVAKPRFGSWGIGVERCADQRELRVYIEALRTLPWKRPGAIAQELVPPTARDLRIIVAAGRVVGAASRTPAPGEWRTNVALGGSSSPAVPDATASLLACSAVSVLGLDLAGVDLLPRAGSWVVLEVNGAVDFLPAYSQAGDAFASAMDALARAQLLVGA